MNTSLCSEIKLRRFWRKNAFQESDLFFLKELFFDQKSCSVLSDFLLKIILPTKSVSIRYKILDFKR